jgi:small multidrug resistance pump
MLETWPHRAAAHQIPPTAGNGGRNAGVESGSNDVGYHRIAAAVVLDARAAKERGLPLGMPLNPRRSRERRMQWLYLVIAIVTEVAATTALKAADGFTKLVPSVIVVVGYGASFYFLSLALRSIPVGVAYAVWSGVGIVLIAVLGYAFYRQTLDVPAVVGMALIGIGVIVISALSKAGVH